MEIVDGSGLWQGAAHIQSSQAAAGENSILTRPGTIANISAITGWIVPVILLPLRTEAKP